MTAPRPTSPHLTVYRWLITNTLSILHRITGFGLAIGTILLVMWLVSAAYYPVFYLELQEFMGSIIGRLALLGWTFAFFYHFSNGIRHLFWDMGKGFELSTVNASGMAVIAFTVIMTGASWFYAGTQSIPTHQRSAASYDVHSEEDHDYQQEQPYGHAEEIR